ncbi:hypothetical protein FIBSPDRAFT_867970 [Athelia psychrophila]|uniref:F-box domain-containing protein n=1 Tax=Athelia psychrophila TaxID=1759441 RepID=A0A166DLA6_9AGAM|nr:hypothetical protein FIBSPDRAFT_867970 [Fibularhizoctonia sp. CBS 109695]
MERTPSEIWTKIFAHACTDSGETGRQLSLVSKFIRAASAPVKYQSIAVHGPRQIMDFHQLLLQTPAHLRQIKYLLLTTKPLLLPQEHEPLSEACLGVLTAASVSVEILYLNVPENSNLWYLPIISFPRLIELESHSFPHHRIETNIAQFPQLRRWYYIHITYGAVTGNQHLINNIRVIAPAITHLRFSGLQVESLFASDLMAALPETIQLVYVKPAARPAYGRWRRPYYQRFTAELEELNKIDNRLVLLPAYISNETASTSIVSDWEERINGGDGCWSLRERLLGDNDASASGEPRHEAPHCVRK